MEKLGDTKSERDRLYDSKKEELLEELFTIFPFKRPELIDEERTNEICIFLGKYVTDLNQFYYGDGLPEFIENAFTEIKYISTEGGLIDGQLIRSIYYIKDYDMYLEFKGTYHSYGETEYNELAEGKRVYPKTITKTIYTTK